MVPGAVFGDVLTWELVHLVQLTVTTEALAASKRVEDKGQMGCYSVDIFAEAGNIALRRRPAKLGCIEGAVRWFGGGSGTLRCGSGVALIAGQMRHARPDSGSGTAAICGVDANPGA